MNNADRLLNLKIDIARYEEILTTCERDYMTVCNTYVYSESGKREALNTEYDYICMYRDAIKEMKQELAALLSQFRSNRFIKSSFTLSLLWTVKFYKALSLQYGFPTNRKACTSRGIAEQCLFRLAKSLNVLGYTFGLDMPNTHKFLVARL
jgi:hypothetical protein